MMTANNDEALFRIALSTRQETDPGRFDTYFFDSSVVYVYLSRGHDSLSFISNLVHEIGHSLLANSPLGFIHQSLFELSASACDYLWIQHISPIFESNIGVEEESGQREGDLYQLEEKGPRNARRRRGVKNEAQNLLSRSSEKLYEALRQEKHLIAALLHIEERRNILIESSRLCHEAIATFAQFGPNAKARYEAIIGQLIPEEERAAIKKGLPEAIEAQRKNLTGVWEEGYKTASSIYEATGIENMVFLSGHVAHHFPYQKCHLLDMSFNDFQKWTSSTLLGASVRFKMLALKPTLLKEGEILKSLVDAESLDLPINETKSFQLWHRQQILESECAKAIIQILPNSVTGIRQNIKDDWTESLMPISQQWMMPPIIFDNGQILAPNQRIARMIQIDFVRATRLKSVMKILSKLSI